MLISLNDLRFFANVALAAEIKKSDSELKVNRNGKQQSELKWMECLKIMTEGLMKTSRHVSTEDGGSKQL
jgi:hypothetical protein